MSDSPAPDPPVNRDGWWTREHTLVIVLAAATAILVALCWQLVQPFISPIAWAVALAVVAHPVHRAIARRVRNPNLAATLAVGAITLILVTPAVFVANSIVREAGTGVKAVQSRLESGEWREQLAKSPRLGGALQALESKVNIGNQISGVTSEVGRRVSQAVAGSAWALVELLLTLFVLFYLFRDRREALDTLRSLVPLSERESDEVFQRAADTIHATLYGTLVVAAVQGALSGLMFWWLGLPAPILWGVVMALLAIVPVLGAFVIWVPAAIFLAASGEWGKALILTAWGGIVVALVDNLLYPILVGKRLRLHTVPVFFAILGGLAIFGAAGLIIGPLILALTDALLEIWRRRTAHGRPAEAATARGA